LLLLRFPALRDGVAVVIVVVPRIPVARDRVVAIAPHGSRIAQPTPPMIAPPIASPSPMLSQKLRPVRSAYMSGLPPAYAYGVRVVSSSGSTLMNSAVAGS
jgi:hypothetical protein